MRLLVLVLLLFFVACKQDSLVSTNHQITIFQSKKSIKIKDAKGFQFVEKDSFYVLSVRSLSQRYPFNDSLIFPKFKIENRSRVWSSSFTKIACQSSTHVTFLNALGKIKLIKGMSDIGFMPKDKIYERLMEQEVVELNQNNSVNMEQLAMLFPDLFLMYPFEWESKKFKQANIKTLLVAEYLEHTPIARLEWIKFFGLLVGEEEKADSIFEHIKQDYESLVSKKLTDKTVFFNLPFKEFWDMPATNSITTNLIQDAGLNYVFRKTDSTNLDNLSFAKELVWEQVYDADYWIIIANRPKNYSLEDLLKEEPVYRTFKAVKQKQVIFCNTGETSYFTMGILEPDVMLKDLLLLTNQLEDHTLKYFQFLK